MIHIILGTKAQLIKMAPVMIELQKQEIDYNFIFTGQHKETIDELLSNFKLKKPDYILYSGKDITGIFQMALWIIKILFKTFKNKKEIFKNDKNGIVLVHGDTFSTFLGALMGKITKLNIAHVESGLRSFNLLNPFPEEITRILVFKLSNYYFCPGEWTLNNLRKYKGKKINTKENTLFDSLALAIKNKEDEKINIPNDEYVVFTIHRFENIFNKKRFEDIIDIIENISKKFKVLFILHPPTKKKLEEYNFISRLEQNNNVDLRPRYNYFEFIRLINKSEFVATDGGSNQEECFYLGKPCILLRYETERKEGLEKNVVLTKFNKKIIEDFINSYKNYKTEMLSDIISPSKLIVDSIREFK
ncbi:UDP-N-acetylglucosamine 2-epimerase (non-hydrolyzing) [archaeon]|nr:UDP-N-acetylglucosamine 2-epimerase (non-hydrolyzing) [archaeon]|tara:strand:+ start:1159 stop:2238 length:1080 start_codon:yes stop_codon:yes gene_type:complete